MAIISFEHFVEISDPEWAATLFKRSVGLVAFSISSYCNRRCSYCPNSIADRTSTRNYMSDGLFFNILSQLSKIDYSNEINITRYNEPFADKEYALRRIRDIRAFLPKSTIQIYTNGDYLDRPYLEELAKCGVDHIVATVHSGPGGRTDLGALIEDQDRRLSELGIPFEIEIDPTGKAVRTAKGSIGDRLKLTYVARNFYYGVESGNAWAYDRGGSLPIPKTFERIDPCLVQFGEMNIEWDGTLLPCCQIQNEVFAHDDYVLGKLDADSDMFLAWTSRAYVEWRQKMFTFEKKGAPCSTCTYGICDRTLLSGLIPAMHSASRKVSPRELAAASRALSAVAEA